MLYQETQGVCVATYGMSNNFPAFFSPQSGFASPYHVNDAKDAAELIGEKNLIHTSTAPSLSSQPLNQLRDMNNITWPKNIYIQKGVSFFLKFILLQFVFNCVLTMYCGTLRFS